MDWRKSYRKFIKHIYKEFEPEIREHGFASVPKLMELRRERERREQEEMDAFYADETNHLYVDENGVGPLIEP